MSSTYDWTQVSQATGEHANQYSNRPVMVAILLNKESKPKKPIYLLSVWNKIWMKTYMYFY